MPKINSYQDYLKKHPEWERELELLHQLISKTELEQTIKWGAPVYTLQNKNVVGLGAFKSYVGLWFFNGVLLKDKDKVLVNAQEGKTKAMRQWRFNSEKEIKKRQLTSYLKEAIENQRAGKSIKPEKTNTSLELPQELQQLLKTRKELRQQFNSLTPYKQKEYAEHIGSAKRETTRQSRLEKAIPLIEKGVGLHDKYRNC
ncbi:MAG: YdeI/OmpD-associated family protein [Kangiellaceae bacterium]|nr:YdeI/OmpD-associated family protein [Kangiellaceae bacterium]MCW8997792.1 YdeI/OmpD-associated family protein [Kangiellaceae bacterium]MCW9018383.1 YdeI/OmpD-associated family protein [Kangiellaceae bacterium]